MREAYRIADGKFYQSFDALPLFEKFRFDENERIELYEYLQSNALLRFRGGNTFEITHEGMHFLAKRSGLFVVITRWIMKNIWAVLLALIIGLLLSLVKINLGIH